MITYEEFKEMHKEPKYFNNICFVAGCNNLAEYEGGDARFYCGVCEQHSRLQERYNILINAEKKMASYMAQLLHSNTEDIDCNKYNF